MYTDHVLCIQLMLFNYDILPHCNELMEWMKGLYKHISQHSINEGVICGSVNAVYREDLHAPTWCRGGNLVVWPSFVVRHQCVRCPTQSEEKQWAARLSLKNAIYGYQTISSFNLPLHSGLQSPRRLCHTSDSWDFYRLCFFN